MKKISPLHFLGLMILLLSLIFLAAAYWPVQREQQVIISTIGNSLISAPETEDVEWPETRLLTIEWPRAVRVGDAELIQLTFKLDPTVGVPSEPETDASQNDDQIIVVPDLYRSHNLVLESRLDMAGMQVSPQAAISETLRPGQDLDFYWSISPTQVGTIRGNLWVYLNIVPKGGGEIDRRALVAYRMEIEARSVLGFPANIARWGGAAGTLLGLAFSAPFLEDILRRSWRKIRKKLGK
jgi:hypothetical protein